MPEFKDNRCASTLMEHAAHEAGHYTVLRLLRQLYRTRIKRVIIQGATIVSTFDSGGRVRAKIYRWDIPVAVFSSTLDEKEPELLYKLAGMAGQSLWLYLEGQRKVEEGVEDLGPGMEELQDTARAIVSTWDSELWRENAKLAGKRKWEIFNNLPPSENPVRTPSDIEQVRALIGNQEWEPFYVKALEVVHQHWPAVLRVAKALVEKRTLNAREAHLAFAGEG